MSFNNISIGDGATVYSGYAFKSSDLTDAGIPVVKIGNIQNRIIDYSSTQFFPEDKLTDKQSKFLLEDKDVLIAMTGQGSVGRVGRIRILGDKKILLNQRVGKFVTDKTKLDNGFLYYVISSSQYAEILFNAGTGSGQPNLSPKVILDIKIPLPPLLEQKAIANILSCLDDKIELNNRINENLEEMAQAIFKSWFVDFDPFQNGEFEDSELGRIPKGWSVGTIEQIAEICIGGDWGSEKQDVGLEPVICLRGTDLQSLKETGFSSNAPIRWVKPDSIIKRGIVNSDILIGGSGLGPIGRSLYCSDSLNKLYRYPIIYSNFCKRLRSRNYQSAIYLESIIEILYLQGALKSYMNGTSIPNLDINSLIKRSILIPSDEVILSFANFKRIYFNRIFSNENQKLSIIRDTLLPKLMSGEIRVPIEEVQ